jgi:polygalacturonase
MKIQELYGRSLWVYLESIAMLLALTPIGDAQDRRSVQEPKIPATCLTLNAVLKARLGKLAPEDESRLDTIRVQSALDSCAGGQAVELAPEGDSNVFLVGPIQIPKGVTLVIDRGVTLMASRDPHVYDMQAGSCGVVNDQSEGCRPVISVSHAPHAAIMGDGVIDGRGGERLLDRDVTWWDLAERATAGGRQQVPRLIVVDGSDDFTLYRITLRNSANFHVLYRDGRGFTVWNLKIDTPQHARNTDGVDPASAEDITVTHSFIRTGDDNIAIKGSGNGVGYMSVVDNHFYYGHGMSIGSETFGGVHDILVRNLSLDGPDNGLRIKSNASRGGIVERVSYSDVCIRDSKRPIVLDTHYDNPGPRNNLIPVFRDISFEHVEILGGGQISAMGADASHRLSVSMSDVMLDHPAQYRLQADHATIGYGPRPVNFRLLGKDVTAIGTPSEGQGVTCRTPFVPFNAAYSF